MTQNSFLDEDAIEVIKEALPCLPDFDEIEWSQMFFEFKPTFGGIYEVTLVMVHKRGKKIRVDFESPSRQIQNVKPEDIRMNYFGDFHGYPNNTVDWKRL